MEAQKKGGIVVGLFLVILLLWVLFATSPSEDSKSPKKPKKIYDESRLPPEFHAGHISQSYQHNDLDRLHWGLTTVFERSSRFHHELPATPRMDHLGTGYDTTTRGKLQHDYEQALYLSQSLLESNPEKAMYFKDTVAPIYSQVLANSQSTSEYSLYQLQPKDLEVGISKIYNRALHVTNLETGDVVEEEGLINPTLLSKENVQKVEHQWFQSGDQPDKPAGVLVLDNVMKSHVLDRVYQIMLESTVFYQTNPTHAYVGAYMSDGLHDRLLLDLALELSQAFPKIFKGHPLNFMWAYKYDSSHQNGIVIHADEAAVNVNCWLTPDEANLDPESGGLVVYTAKPPADWDFRAYNSNPDYVKENLLRPTNFANVTVPYKQNRCVVFDSALFHNTDTYHFKPGYKHRRINLTMLYGEMQKAQAMSGSSTTNVKVEL